METVVTSPFVMVIFGATGDLTARKLMPALYALWTRDLLPEQFFITGVSRREITSDIFREMMKTAVQEHGKGLTAPGDAFESQWERFSRSLHYQQGMFDDPKPYQELIALLSSFDKNIGACIARFFYLATPPVNYSAILSHLASSKLAEGCGQGSNKWTRILIEKPFGKDPQTARQLEGQLDATFDERQIYRIDHYLAKETIQNILAFRFANGMFEPLWNSEHINHVQITIAESAGVGNRGSFYEGVGALRDVAQNHLMAMLAYTAMERPRSLFMDDIRNERVAALKAIRSMRPEEVVRGQYGAAVMKDRHVVGYRQEKDISSDSMTETYVALKLFLDNPRWQGVPFYLRTGKRLPVSAAQISVQFKQPTQMLFGAVSSSWPTFAEATVGKQARVLVGALAQAGPGSEQSHSDAGQASMTNASVVSKDSAHANVLTFRIQPREGISLHMLAKKPGLDFALQPVQMDFSYHSSFAGKLTDSYERLLIDSMKADQTLFATYEGFATTWKLIQEIVEGWRTRSVVFPNYSAGTWGPGEAEELIARDGRQWLL